MPKTAPNRMNSIAKGPSRRPDINRNVIIGLTREDP